jgi:hypothetical protein
MKNAELRRELIEGAKRNLRAAAAYRQRIWNRPDVNVYDCGEDKKFADAMWEGCMNNARSARRMAKVA